ncbi:MAG: hypothetical protein Q7K57_49280 [Burkholderiaceae bacterium]|jgi:hypothetical protein|nr:hypothetical protein [Burkholderiaceae bacterium]
MSTIQVAQRVMVYRSANERTSCKNCYHVDESFADRSPPWNTKTWRCKKGGFSTTAMAICEQHQPVQTKKA